MMSSSGAAGASSTRDITAAANGSVPCPRGVTTTFRCSLVDVTGIVVGVEKPVLEDELVTRQLEARAAHLTYEGVHERLCKAEVLASDRAAYAPLELPVPRRRVLSGKIEVHDVAKVEIRPRRARRPRRLRREPVDEPQQSAVRGRVSHGSRAPVPRQAIPPSWSKSMVSVPSSLGRAWDRSNASMKSVDASPPSTNRRKSIGKSTEFRTIQGANLTARACCRASGVSRSVEVDQAELR